MSIANKVTLVVSLFTGLVLIATGYGGLFVQESAALDQARQTGRLLAAVISQAAHVAVRDQGHLGSLADVGSQQQPFEVLFFGGDGRLVAPTAGDSAPVVNPRARRVIQQQRPEEEVLSTAEVPTYVYRAPLYHQRRVVGSFELRFGSSPLPGPAIRNALLVAGGALVLFALFVGLYSRRTIGRPIARLMDGMDDVIRGDLTAALPLERSDEIGRIAYRFNEMIAQLRAAQEEIRRSAAAKLTLEQTLRQSEKLATIGQLSAEIAHEVGTPLNVIGGRARVLHRKADLPDEVRKNATIIAEQATRITKIIQQMLDLARARAPQHGAVDLARIIDGAVAFLEYRAEQAAVEFAREIVPELPAVYGDADGIQQVVLNLLLNGIQAMPNGGRLTIRAAPEHRRKGGLALAPPQEYAVVTIEDTGEGISDEQRARIFDPFYSTKSDGTGLGLTVVHGIVKQHDGWIDVDPVEPRGTAFRVYLPTERERAEETAAEADPAAEAADATAAESRDATESGDAEEAGEADAPTAAQPAIATAAEPADETEAAADDAQRPAMEQR